MSKAVVSYLAATCIIISHYETFSGSHVAYMLGHVSCCNLPYLLHVLTSDDLFAIVVRHLHPMQASPFRAPWLAHFLTISVCICAYTSVSVSACLSNGRRRLSTSPTCCTRDRSHSPNVSRPSPSATSLSLAFPLPVAQYHLASLCIVMKAATHSTKTCLRARHVLTPMWPKPSDPRCWCYVGDLSWSEGGSSMGGLEEWLLDLSPTCLGWPDLAETAHVDLKVRVEVEFDKIEGRLSLPLRFIGLTSRGGAFFVGSWHFADFFLFTFWIVCWFMSSLSLFYFLNSVSLSFCLGFMLSCMCGDLVVFSNFEMSA